MELGDQDQPEAIVAFLDWGGFLKEARTEDTDNTERGLLFRLGLPKFIPTSISLPVKHADLTSKIIGICIKVHKILGPGLLESVYEKAICLELTLAGLSFRRQQGIRVIYEGVDLDLGFRADIIVEEEVLLEIKSTQLVTPVHKKITLTYLKFTEIEVGLIVNFNVIKLTDGITRLVLDKVT